MKCPVDDTVLQMTHRDGVEIDYCPTCRGVWLDRGELDKIVERASGYASPASSAPSPRSTGERQHEAEHERRPYRQKRQSLLGELFDF